MITSQHNKSCTWQTHSQHHSELEEILKVCPSWPRTRKEYPLLLLLFNIVPEVLAREIKGKKIRKEDRLSMFTDDIVYT
jgi:hypothetical protein